MVAAVEIRPSGRKVRRGIVTGKGRQGSDNTDARLSNALTVLDEIGIEVPKVLDLCADGYNVSPGKVEREAYRIRRNLARLQKMHPTMEVLPGGPRGMLGESMGEADALEMPAPQASE